VHPALRDEEWRRRYAARIAELKGIGDAGQREELGRVLDAAFMRVYRFVAFDIDGTLTSGDSAAVDPEMAKIIGELLSRSVAVVLITGRGRASTRRAVEEISELSELHHSYLRRLSCITHNGVFLLKTRPDAPRELLADETLLVEKNLDLESLARVAEEKLASLCPEESFEVEVEPGSLRIRFFSPDAMPEDTTELGEALMETCSVDLHLSSGTYAGIRSLDVAPSNKQIALKALASLAGIPPEAILRIGDQGQPGGNDFDLLDSPAGFSVGDFSDSRAGCFPVLDEDLEEAVGGAEATRLLRDRVLLFPPISITPQPHDACLAALRDFNRRAAARAKTEARAARRKIQARIGDLLPDSERELEEELEIFDIFDPRSGGVRFADWEIDEVDANSLAQRLFEFPRPDGPLPPASGRSIYTDTAILARGPLYYYSDTQPPERLNLGAYLATSIKFLDDAADLVAEIEARPFSLLDYKLVAAVQDNVRNIVLQCQFATYRIEREGGKSYQGLARDFYRRGLLAHTSEQIAYLIDDRRDWEKTLADYRGVLRIIAGRLAEMAKDLPVLDDETKLFKWRECDHFIENLMAVDIGLRKLREDSVLRRASKLRCVGLAYGGIELPAIAEALSAGRSYEVEAVISRISVYSDAEVGEKVRGGGEQYVDLLRKLDRPFCFLSGAEDLEEGVPTVIMDDNCTTAVTLQTARDALVMRGADVVGAVIVRMPGVNRQVQMAMDDHGFPDPDLLFSFVRGFVAPSPYARLIQPGEPGVKTQYLDQTGIFDKQEERIKRYMQKNGTPFHD
jgi:HAD superfamily hydrolase (TIGR01484 family)